MNDEQIHDLAKRAIATFEALTPEAQRAHRKAQARSWTRGTLALSGKKFDEAAFDAIWEKVHGDE